MTFTYRQKINFILYVFLEILQRYCKLFVLGTFDMSDYTNPKWYYHLVEDFCVYLQAKNQLHSPCFTGDLAKICKLLILGTLGMHRYKHCPLWCLSACLKHIFIIYFFLEILHFKESCNLIGQNAVTFWPITSEPEFCQIWGWRWNINSNISFHFRLFLGKTNDKIFRKIQKNLLWAHFAPFLKLVPTIFYQIFIFSPNDSPSKPVKNLFYFI